MSPMQWLRPDVLSEPRPRSMLERLNVNTQATLHTVQQSNATRAPGRDGTKRRAARVPPRENSQGTGSLHGTASGDRPHQRTARSALLRRRPRAPTTQRTIFQLMSINIR